MEKKVLLKELVDSGTNIRREFIPKAVVSTEGKYQIGEFWDANKTIDVIVNNSHQQHDNIRELDEFAHNLDTIKVGRISVNDVTNLTESDINKLKTGDTVIDTTDKDAYTVVNKSDTEMSIVYSDAGIIKEIQYQKENDQWAYTQTNTFDPADKQDVLVSGVNIKTVNGNNILGSGDIDIQSTILANEQMPASWDTTHTMHDLINSINADPNAVPGKIYLSTVHISDLPSGILQAEVKVEVMGQQAGKKILLFSITSADISPYRWEYTAYNMSEGPWRSWMPSDGAYTKAQIDQMIQNAGSEVSHVFLTQSEYDAIQDVNQNAIYFILEPEPGSGFPLQFPITLA